MALAANNGYQSVFKTLQNCNPIIWFYLVPYPGNFIFWVFYLFTVDTIHVLYIPRTGRNKREIRLRSFCKDYNNNIAQSAGAVEYTD